MRTPTRFIKADPYDKSKDPLPETATELPPPPASSEQPQTTTTTTTTAQNASSVWTTQAGQGITGGWSTGTATVMGIKRPGEKTVPVYGAAADVRLQGDTMYTYKQQNRVSAEQYSAEYYERVLNDTSLRQWWADKAIALGYAKYDASSPFGVAEDEFMAGGVRNLWELAGSVVQMSPTLNTLTPEEWVESLYNANGGANRLAAAKAAASPITTQTQISTTSMSRAQADAVADEVAMQVLGRMATKSEMAKARKAMNRMLAANPTKTTQTMDATDPANTTITSKTEAGVSAADAAAAYEQKLRRGSEGMAFNVGKGIENALAGMDRNL